MAVGAGRMCAPWSHVLVSALLVVAVLCAALAPVLISSRSTPTISQAAARANRHATLGSISGITLQVALMTVFAFTALVAPRLSSGRVIASLPAVGGLCLALTQALTQVTWPRPTGVHREADLTRRRRADVVETGTHRLVIVWSVAILIALALFTTLSSGPRTISAQTGSALVQWSPYPGAHYALPVALTTLAVVLATELVLRLVVVRPAVPAVPREWDLQLRRRSARHLIAGAQLALAGTLTGLLVLAGIGHRHIGQGAIGATLFVAAGAVTLVALSGLRPGRARGEAHASAADAVTP